MTATSGLRRSISPSVSKPGPGLTDLITDPNLSGHLVDLVHPTSVPGVSLVHGGTSVDNAAELVATKGARLLEQARSLADVVIMDTAPLLVVSDASELLPEVDAVVIVARVHRTTRENAGRTSELLDRAEIPVLGVVLVGTQSPGMAYYGRQYGYGPPVAKTNWRHRGSPGGVMSTWSGSTPGSGFRTGSESVPGIGGPAQRIPSRRSWRIWRMLLRTPNSTRWLGRETVAPDSPRRSRQEPGQG